jgi:chromosome segregation ATPase
MSVGKSTVTHAICLACGGGGVTVGRSPDIKQFVKKGKEDFESFVEVDIYRIDAVVTIRREINAQTKSSKWFLNGQKTNQESIKQLLVGLNIDVDNLWYANLFAILDITIRFISNLILSYFLLQCFHAPRQSWKVHTV